MGWAQALQNNWSKVKVGVLCPVQQQESYWDRSSILSLVGVKLTQK